MLKAIHSIRKQLFPSRKKYVDEAPSVSVFFVKYINQKFTQIIISGIIPNGVRKCYCGLEESLHYSVHLILILSFDSMVIENLYARKSHFFL